MSETYRDTLIFQIQTLNAFDGHLYPQFQITSRSFLLSRFHIEPALYMAVVCELYTGMLFSLNLLGIIISMVHNY